MGEPCFFLVSTRSVFAKTVQNIFSVFSREVMLTGNASDIQVCTVDADGQAPILVDLDGLDSHRLLELLANHEQLPELFFITSHPAKSCLSDQNDICPFGQYIVQKAHRLWVRQCGSTTEEFLQDRVVSPDKLPSLAVARPPAYKKPIPNVFRQTLGILFDFGLGADPEILSRLAGIDSDFCLCDHDRELCRLRDYHKRGDSVKKRILADFVVDNVRYYQEGCPIRRVFWIEDNPDLPLQGGPGFSKIGSLKAAVAHSFSYYPNTSVYLLTSNLAELFRRVMSNPSATQPILDGLGVEQLLGGLDHSTPLALADFDAVVLDLNFEKEERISGKNLIPPLLEVHSKLPIVILSGSEDPEVLEAVLRSGADFYLPKRYSFSLPVYINRCHTVASDEGDPYFLEKSRRRQQLLGTRQQVRIRLDS